MYVHRYIYRARLLSVIDGDTVIVDTDIGRNMYIIRDRLRLNGVNAPEKGATGYHAAKNFVESHLSVGVFYQVETFKTQEKYGRWLADVYLHDGRKLNDMMIESGNAVRYTR